jgi:hypothetical protein
MKKVFLLIVVPALLVALGFAQTPAASGITDQVNIKGCLGGSDGNYTVAEDNTGKIFKITTSSTDLKAHLGQDVNLTGQKASTAENGFAVTQVNMISEHCTAATAAAAPAASVSAPPETVSTPPAAASAPAATVSAPAETVSAPAATAAVHRTRPSARTRKPGATPAVTPAGALAPAEPVSTPVADAAVPVAPAGQPSETASTPAAPAAPATKTSTSRSIGMIVSIVVVVLVIGAGVPLYNRWKKRKLLEETKGQNLSFTKEAKSDPGKSDTTGGRKAA